MTSCTTGLFIYSLLGCLLVNSIKVPPTSGNLNVGFHLGSASGKGSSMVGQFELANGTGQLNFHGKQYSVVAYQYQDWVSAGYFLYDLVGVSTDTTDLAVFYIYCNLQGSIIDSIWYESYDVRMNYESASGRVTDTVTPSSIHVTLPGLTLGPTPVRTGINIRGNSINFALTTGWSIFLGKRYNITVFNTVDCSSCGGDGWYELHSLLVPDESDACFGIFYLMLGDHSSVVMDYGFCIPTLETPSPSFTAQWSGSLLDSTALIWEQQMPLLPSVQV